MLICQSKVNVDENIFLAVASSLRPKNGRMFARGKYETRISIQANDLLANTEIEISFLDLTMVFNSNFYAK